MRIRVMHIVYGLGRGGLQSGLENLLGGLDRERYEHVICALRPPIDHPMCAGLSHLARLMCLGTTQSPSRFQVRGLAKAIRDVKPDIVHSRNWGCIEAVIASRWVGSCAIVHGEHGIDTDLVGSEPRRRVWFRRLAFEMAHRIVSVSYQLRDLHSHRTRFPATKITVVHNGVNDRKFAPDPSIRARVRADLGFRENDLCIGSVGNLSTVKDYMTELQAVATIARKLEHWRLVIVGEGPERPKLEAFVKAHPEWNERVLLTGLTLRVPELLNAFDVFVLSSVTEGICNSLLEAMATGLPVIATETGGNPEIVVDRESGLLFPVGDSDKLAEILLSLHAQPELRRRLGQNARDRVRKEFSVDSMVDGYDLIYSSLVQRVA